MRLAAPPVAEVDRLQTAKLKRYLFGGGGVDPHGRDDVTIRTRRRQRWRSRPADPYRKSQNFPPFDFDFDDVFDVDDMFDFDDDDFRSGGRF